MAKASDEIGSVIQLGSLTVAEVVDVDPTATREDVQEAIRIAIVQSAPQLLEELPFTTVTGLWVTKLGTHVAAVSMSRRMLARLDKIKVG